jgi:hypothetical protein
MESFFHSMKAEYGENHLPVRKVTEVSCVPDWRGGERNAQAQIIGRIETKLVSLFDTQELCGRICLILLPVPYDLCISEFHLL